MKQFLFFLLLSWAMAPGASLADTVVSLDQANDLAQQALAQNDFAAADQLTSAVLAQRPSDARALIVRAILLRNARQFDEARRAASSAWENAETKAARYDAAILAADINNLQGRYTRAQFWLRRADQAAFLPEQKQLVAQSYAAVRQRNPLQVNLRFSLKPSNNVNNGAETTVIDIGGLPFRLDGSGQQLGGWEGSAGVSLGYRLHQEDQSRTDLLGDIYFRKVWLDDDASTLAPGVRDSDFDYGAVVTAIRHQRIIWPTIGKSAITGVVGQSWYGGDALARWTELQLGQTVQRSATSALQFGLQTRFENRLDDSINDSRTIGLSTEFVKDLGNGRGFRLGATVKDIRSESATVDGVSHGVSGTWSMGRIGSFVPSATLAAENRDYQKWATTPGGRTDKTLSLQVNTVWTEKSFYGFVPQATFTVRRTWSNVDIYDRNEYSLGLTAVSRF